MGPVSRLGGCSGQQAAPSLFLAPGFYPLVPYFSMWTLFPFFFFFLGHPSGLMGSYFPDQGLNLGSQQWKHRVLSLDCHSQQIFFPVNHNSGILTWPLSEPPPSLLNLFFFLNARFFRLIAQVWELLGEMSSQGWTLTHCHLSQATIPSPGLSTSTFLRALLPPWPLRCLFPKQKPGGAVET